jgi:hypothetical protein
LTQPLALGDKEGMKCICAPLLLASSLIVSAADYSVRVETGNEGFFDVVVSAPIPDAEFPPTGTLNPQDGPSLPYQTTPDGRIVFVVPAIGPQTVKRYHISSSSQAPTKDQAHADLASGKVTISIAEKKVFTYQGEESELPREDIKPLFKRGGYIHPVYSPSGKLVTDDYPPNHVHHHGIWFPWTKTRFEGRAPDFWNMGEGKGKVEFVQLHHRWSGPVHAGFVAEQRHIDLTSGEAKTALNETWTVTAYHVPGGNYFAFDLVSTQTCASASPLMLPKYHYGGLGFRGNWAWNGATNCEFLTSEGETNRVKGNETRGNWCHIGGEVNRQFTGVAILSHPSNFRSPQPMRLHPTEPFFCFAPSQLGDWAIEPGKPYVSRYRFIVRDGKPSRQEIDNLWRAYAHPPKVILERL